MDQLLVPFLRASNESEAQQLLDEILVVHTAPSIRFTLLQKLGFHVNSFGLNPNNQDAEDLYHEIIAKILDLLRALRENPTTKVENFHQYVERTAANACYDYVRSKSPARTRLKYSLREVLRRRPEFFLRKSQDRTLCGLTAWASREGISSNRLAEIEDEIQTLRTTKFGRDDIRRVSFTRLLAELLTWINAPIELDSLVNIAAVLLNIEEDITDSLDLEPRGYPETRISDIAMTRDSELDFENFLRHLWQVVTKLPEKQRDTFCFNFEDLKGEDLFTLLLEAKIVSLPQLAQQLGRSLGELMRLWSEMPMDKATIAVELGATRLQVNKWRFYALSHLAKELEPFATRK